jgi:chaperonin cofactor prefoldin
MIPQGLIIERRLFDQVVKELTERIERLENQVKELQPDKRPYTKRSEKWTKAD